MKFEIFDTTFHPYLHELIKKAARKKISIWYLQIMTLFFAVSFLLKNVRRRYLTISHSLRGDLLDSLILRAKIQVWILKACHLTFKMLLYSWAVQTGYNFVEVLLPFALRFYVFMKLTTSNSREKYKILQYQSFTSQFLFLIFYDLWIIKFCCNLDLPAA